MLFLFYFIVKWSLGGSLLPFDIVYCLQVSPIGEMYVVPHPIHFPRGINSSSIIFLCIQVEGDEQTLYVNVLL